MHCLQPSAHPVPVVTDHRLQRLTAEPGIAVVQGRRLHDTKIWQVMLHGADKQDLLRLRSMTAVASENQRLQGNLLGKQLRVDTKDTE